MARLTIIRILFSIVLSSFFITEIHAQRDNDPMAPGSFYEVSGQVRSADNKPVENVMVRIVSSNGALVDQGTADSMGRFRFIRLRSGQYTVSASAAGLISQPQPVDLSRASPRVHVLLQLVPEPPTFRLEATGAAVIDARIPPKAREELEKGRIALTEKKSSEAVIHFQKAAQLYPDYYQAHMLLGQSYMDNSQWEKAEQALLQAVKIDPKAVTAMVSLGEVYRREKKYPVAQKVLEQALKLDNNSFETNFTLGRIHWELKDIARAGQYVARSIELQPNIAEAHLLAGNIFMRAGLPVNALVEYQEYLRLAPNGEFAAQTQVLVEKLKKSLPSK